MLTESGSSMRAPKSNGRVGSAHQPESVGPAHPTKPKSRRDWSPTQNDVRIFELVKFDCLSQADVAAGMGISQATVSRILQRMERWQAHVEGRAAGRLDPAERLRAQQWLTFERNEVILGSALRLAREVEGAIDTSSSVIHRPVGLPSEENCILSTHATRDRTGLVAKFLRLAFDVNMKQLQLCASEPLPLPEPLSDEELAIEEQRAAEDAEELAATTARQHAEARRLAAEAEQELAAERAAAERDRTERAEWERQIAEMQASEAALQARTQSHQKALLVKPAVAPTTRLDEPAAADDAAPESCTIMHPVHNQPAEEPTEIAATAGWDLGYDEATPEEDFSSEACIRPATDAVESFNAKPKAPASAERNVARARSPAAKR